MTSNQNPQAAKHLGGKKTKNSAIAPILSHSSHNWQEYSSGKAFKPPRNSCKFCSQDFRLNVVSDRHTSRKFLKAGCCDAFLRVCPSPDELLRSPNLSNEEREYLYKITTLDWFSGAVAAVILQIEGRVSDGRVADAK